MNFTNREFQTRYEKLFMTVLLWLNINTSSCFFIPFSKVRLKRNENVKIIVVNLKSLTTMISQINNFYAKCEMTWSFLGYITEVVWVVYTLFKPIIIRLIFIFICMNYFRFYEIFVKVYCSWVVMVEQVSKYFQIKKRGKLLTDDELSK